jgi:hypothetical protein
MSANIPSTMPMSDLLKSTGYNCPEELQGKTFDEATSGGDAKISTNTAATVDVSQYTEPVEITPAEGYDATKKVTVSLSNIPSGGSATLYAWKQGVTFLYLNIDTAPKNTADAQNIKYLLVGPETKQMSIDQFLQDTMTYEYIADNEFNILQDGQIIASFSRSSANDDVTLWG